MSAEMNATPPLAASTGRLLSGDEYRESLRRYRPTVYVDGRRIESVVDAPELQPGINALAVTYDFALDPAKARLMTAQQSRRGVTVNRMLHLDESAGDLLNGGAGGGLLFGFAHQVVSKTVKAKAPRGLRVAPD